MGLLDQFTNRVNEDRKNRVNYGLIQAQNSADKPNSDKPGLFYGDMPETMLLGLQNVPIPGTDKARMGLNRFSLKIPDSNFEVPPTYGVSANTPFGDKDQYSVSAGVNRLGSDDPALRVGLGWRF
mgnify:FL=1|tara:strand:+ start:195 stop:569 length:375 start_codon:yes stop_codon:yes gene_type:complete